MSNYDMNLEASVKICAKLCRSARGCLVLLPERARLVMRHTKCSLYMEGALKGEFLTRSVRRLSRIA